MLQSYPYPLNRTTVLDEGIHIRLFPSTHRFAIPWREIEVVHRIPHGVRLQLGERSPVRIASPRHMALVEAIVSVCPPDKFDPTLGPARWFTV